MKTIQRTQWHTHFNRTLPPVLTVEPGEEVVFETMDACFGEVRSSADFEAYRKKPKPGGNPLAGPVYVKGAEPGNTLTVDILRIELDGSGFQLVGPNRGMVRDEVEEWTCCAIQGHGDRFTLSNGMTLQADPVVGSFGNAPTGDPTNAPNLLGGNCDIPAVKTGCRLHLPIETPGALFSLGDVHACQGDGEVVGAPEVEAKVVVRFGIEQGRKADGFIIEDTREWHAAGSAETEADAARCAVFRNARFIAAEYDVALKDALIFLTLAGRLTLARTGKWGSLNPVVCSSFSKQMVRAAFTDYER